MMGNLNRSLLSRVKRYYLIEISGEILRFCNDTLFVYPCLFNSKAFKNIKEY